MKKIVVTVGDLHGCLEEFKELLNVLQYNKDQMRLVLLGDLVDRGPDSVGCVKFVQELGVECIMGNHEDKHLRWRKHEKRRSESGIINPMKRMSRDKLNTYEALSDDDFNWLNKLPVKLELFPGTWAVHGGVEPRYTLEKQIPNQIIRLRYVDSRGVPQALGENFSQPANTSYWAEVWNGPESIVYGHCVHSLSEPRFDLHKTHMCLGIDTGCVFGGHLTAAVFKDNTAEIVQVKAKSKYYQGFGEE